MPILGGRSRGSLTLTRILITNSHAPLLLLNGELGVICASRSFCEAFGIDAARAEGMPLAEIGGGEWDLPAMQGLLQSASREGADMGDQEMDLVRPGLGDRRLVVNVQYVDNEDAASVRLLLTVEDVTDERNVQEANAVLLMEKDDLLRERAILLEEMQHRVANSLQIIASILLLKARKVTSEESREHLRDAHDRVLSIAAVQKHLEMSLGDVEVGSYLTKLCESLSSSMIRDSGRVALSVYADDATVSSRDAVSLGLVVTELVINALKYAFPDDRRGEVAVRYEVGRESWALSVTDDGVGRPIALPESRSGLGTSIVEALARQLGAEVIISDAGPGARIALESLRAPAAKVVQ
jgi:two-component sensor histidine kinase